MVYGVRVGGNVKITKVSSTGSPTSEPPVDFNGRLSIGFYGLVSPHISELALERTLHVSMPRFKIFHIVVSSQLFLSQWAHWDWPPSHHLGERMLFSFAWEACVAWT